MNEDRLVWIMGSSRSGSSWLLRMLAELDRVVGIDDPHLGHHLGVWRPIALAWAAAVEPPELHDLRELKREDPDYFFSDRYRDAWLPALRELIAARFEAQLDDRSNEAAEPILVIKEPGSQAAELVFEAVPRSRLIFLLRDGRDVVDSWLDAYQRGSWAMDGGAFAVARDGRRALVEWLSSVWAYRTRVVSRAYARLPATRRALVRYEDLLADTTGELGRIIAALGLEAAADEIRSIVDRHAYSRIGSGERGALGEVRRAEPGGWRRNLSSAEQRAMHEIMGPELAAFGYVEPGHTEAVA